MLLTRRVRAVASWLLCVASVVCSSQVAANRVTVSAERVGRAFYPGETVRLYITASHPRQEASYLVSDYFGRTWQQGTLMLGGNSAVTLRMTQSFPLGWYRLRLLIAGQVVDDAFCVIPLPYQNSRGDDGLFNLQVATIDERQYAAAAQLGIRCFRSDVPWPVVERTRGTYDLERLREQLRLSRKYGIQMMATLDYTPEWTGVGPVNGPDDWIRAQQSGWFVWHPRDVEAWGAFVQRIVDEVRGVTLKWPSPEVLPEGGRYSSRRLPVVQSWEIWNEADHCFYMGSWGRYLDLLRVASCTIKEVFPRSPLIYGGATGNWLTMCITCANRAPVYFDRLAFHPGGEVDQALRLWYRGMYQLPWIDGFPRQNSVNESYLQYADTGQHYESHQQEPGDLYRIRVQLLHWNQDNLFRSSCLHQWIARPEDQWSHNAMLLEQNGGLVPTPLYAAFAGARYWLSDAVYVGHVDMGDRAEAHLLLKQGRPLLIAWADTPVQATVLTEGHVSEVNVMGQESRPSQPYRFVATLGRSPVMIWGAHSDYLQEALLNRYDLFMQTQFGNDAGHTTWYGAGRLEDDLKSWATWPFKAPLDRVMAEAAACLAGDATNSGDALDAALAMLRNGMLQTTMRCRQSGQMAPRAIATIYRLSRVAEWLAAIADERTSLWTTYRTSAGTTEFYRGRLAHYRSQLPRGDGDAEPPFARQLLDLADGQLQRAEEVGGQGAVEVARTQMWVAWEVMNVEARLPHRVFIVGDFGTAVQLRKAHLLEADATHEVVVMVYNFLRRPVAGTVRMSIPATWQASGAVERQFSADALSISDPMLFRFSIPGCASPWQRVSPLAPDSEINLEVPSGLNAMVDLIFRGRLADGTELMPMLYPVYVGRLVQ